MKTFVAIFFALTVLEVATAANQEYFDKIKEASSKCAAEFNIEESVVAEHIKTHKLPETENGKCMMACVMEEMKGLVDGKLNVEAMKEGNKKKWDDPAIVAKADELVDMCNAEVSSEGKNKCDLAVDVVSCFHKHGKAMNIPMPEFKAPSRR